MMISVPNTTLARLFSEEPENFLNVLSCLAVELGGANGADATDFVLRTAQMHGGLAQTYQVAPLLRQLAAALEGAEDRLARADARRASA